jgi:hypothetical protein
LRLGGFFLGGSFMMRFLFASIPKMPVDFIDFAMVVGLIPGLKSPGNVIKYSIYSKILTNWK